MIDPMIHRITLRSHPRLLLLVLLGLALIGAAVLALLFLGLLTGIVALAAAAYLVYLLARFLLSHLQSWVETTDRGLRCRMSDGELLDLPWASVTVAGRAVPPRRPRGGLPTLFVYCEPQDRLLRVPDEYSGFAGLEDRLRRCTRFHEIALEPGESIEERVRRLIE
jgi:hypothetical protein